MGIVSQSPDYGRRLLVNIIDETARVEPDREWISVPNSSDPSDGWRAVTYREAANSINHAAHQLVADSGTSQDGLFPTVAYIGPDDIRYIIVVLGAIKAGYQALMISPRNSTEAQQSLFEATNCKTLYYSHQFQDIVKPWIAGRDMKAILVKSVQSWLPSEDVEPFPYTKTFDEAEWDPLVVLHTSGTTGIPKPVVVRQGLLAINDRYNDYPEWRGTRVALQEIALLTKRMLVTMPLFHAGGLLQSFVLPIYLGQKIAFRISDRPMSDRILVETLRNVEVNTMSTIPSILEQVASSDEAVEELKKLKCVVFGGGSLAPDVGDQLVRRGVKVQSLISASEFCYYPMFYQKNPELWKYIIFDSELFGCDWQRVYEDDDVFEQVIIRKDTKPNFQGFFYTFPDATEYRTKDLWRPHPTVPDHWLYVGRADDVIVFSNGEKLNPVTIEETLTGHPKIRGALVVGAQRFQPALILEPLQSPVDDSQAKELLDEIWPLVVRANEASVAHGRIAREFVALANPEKPFLRAGKGTIQRAATVKLYADEIDTIYENAGEAVSLPAVELDLSSKEALVESLTLLFASISSSAQRLEPTTDFFSAGVDSMQVIQVAKLLRISLEKSGVQLDPSSIAPRVIYNNPCLEQLAGHLLNSANRNKGASPDNGTMDQETKDAEAILKKYTYGLPKAVGNKPKPAAQGQTVLITGTTGALGSYLLDLATTNPNVKKVICLNRSLDAKTRQVNAGLDRGLNIDLAKAEFLQADLSKPNLGLDIATYERLLNEVDRIIHNQWPVNFNISVGSFEPHVRGVRHLVDFSAAAAKQVPLVFVSSISTVEGWRRDELVPEEALYDHSIISTGYGRSKLVSSQILDKAREVSGIPTAIIRVGQIAGPRREKGQWNQQEWFPSLVKSSVYLGLLPNSLGLFNRIDWAPIEDVASVVLEISGITTQVELAKLNGYFHAVNPQTTTWQEIAPAAKEFYGDRIKKLVPLSEWVHALEESQGATDSLEKNPGIKLLDTYKSLSSHSQGENSSVKLDTARTESYSRTLRELGPITPELLKHWCEQWQF